MDTKTLYDLANEADIGFQHDDGYHDAKQVWIDGLMASPEHLEDHWVDWLYANKRDSTEVLRHIGTAYREGQSILTFKDSEKLRGTYAISLTQSLEWASKTLLDTITAGLTKLVEEEAEQWWSDCVGYHSDMNEGCREDWEYEQARDRKLDEA